MRPVFVNLETMTFMSGRRTIFGVAIAALLTVVVVPVAAAGDEPASKPPSLKCDIGPVNKTYGMTHWLVYSCEDQRSVVIVSAPENPAMPFYFMFFPHENGYRLHGEGTGRKEATSAAFEELKALSEEDIALLIELTRKH